MLYCRLQTKLSVLDSCQSVEALCSWRFENYQYSNQVTIQSQVLHLHWVFTEGKIRRELLVLRQKITISGDLALLQFVFLGYISTSSPSNRHSRDPVLRWLGLWPDCRQYSKVLLSVCLSVCAGPIFSDIRAWVMLANWKSMSDVTNMCRYTVDIYQSAGPQSQPQPPGQEQHRNRKIKFVFLFAV